MYLVDPFFLSFIQLLLFQEVFEAIMICLDFEFYAHQVLSEFGVRACKMASISLYIYGVVELIVFSCLL